MLKSIIKYKKYNENFYLVFILPRWLSCSHLFFSKMHSVLCKWSGSSKKYSVHPKIRKLWKNHSSRNHIRHFCLLFRTHKMWRTQTANGAWYHCHKQTWKPASVTNMGANRSRAKVDSRKDVQKFIRNRG